MVVQITIQTRHTIKAAETGSVTHTITNFVKYLRTECPELGFDVLLESVNQIGEDVAIINLRRPDGIDADEFTAGVEDLGELLDGLDIVSDYWWEDVE